MSSLLPPGDDEFDRGPSPPEWSPPGYDRDLARMEQDRGSASPVSLAYWIARAAQGLFGLLRRR